MQELGFVAKKYIQFADEHGYIPTLFNPYNCKDLAGGGNTYRDGTMRKYGIKCNSFGY